MATADLKTPSYLEYTMDEPSPTLAIKKRPTKAKKKERKLRAEQEFQKLEMRDLLRRELELSKKSAEKGRETWENLCKEIKVSEMENELMEWEKKVNRVFAQKDEKIKLILDEMVTTEEMHKRSYSMQLRMMDYLTDTFSAVKKNYKLFYETEASEMLHDFYHEIDERNKIQHRVNLKSESILHATNLIVEQEMSNDYKIFLDKRDDRVNIEVEKRYRLRDSISKKMKIFRQHLMAFLDSLRNASFDVHKYERANTLMERQRNFVTESQKLNEIVVHNSRVHAALQNHIFYEEAEAKRKIVDLKSEYAYYVQMYKNIESDIQRDRETTFEKLKIVTSESFKVLKKYKKLQKYGILLLSLAANCRKLQTESEKIIPSGDFNEPTQVDLHTDQFKLQVLNLKAHVDLSEAELQAEIKLMKNFWRRQALAEAQVVLLEEKKRHLTNENQQYIDTIKRMSKVDNVDDLKETLKIQSMLNEV